MKTNTARFQRPSGKAALLSFQFFLVVLAYYQVKPASRTLFITHIGSELLPYVWIASACVLAVIVPFNNWRTTRHKPLHVICSSCLCLSFLLILFRLLLTNPAAELVLAFYILVDVYSVVLVEQFWSFVAGTYHTQQGKHWYGLIGSGGLLGGMFGGLFASLLVEKTAITTIDLLLVASLLVTLLAVLTFYLGKAGLYTERSFTKPQEEVALNKLSITRRYLVLITLLLLFSQLVEPIIEFKFMTMIEGSISGLDARTSYLSRFFSILSLFALAVNLLITPLVFRLLGPIAGLLFQPAAILFASVWSHCSQSLHSSSILKCADRGLSYSLNRASKELLYNQLPPSVIFSVKSWIDMFGYRFLKAVSSLIIIFVTSYVSPNSAASALTFILIVVIGVWSLTVCLTNSEYADLNNLNSNNTPDQNHSAH